ncbi:MAG: PhzF family phenazine biosynthesis protein [Clostridiales bacterium]|nr:PhzF family phenazine biosynthesis protein [Clostridiales bacterium]
MKLYIADAFTETSFGGNPAGVVLLEKDQGFPDDEIMRKTAAELRYSETAFIKVLSANEFNIRYFTPAAEVELCGHATIASFKCLLSAGLVKPGNTYINKTLAGTLKIEVKDDFIMMEMASPKILGTIEDESAIARLYEIMGIKYQPITASSLRGGEIKLLPMLVSTGLPDIIMPLATRQQLRDLNPDFPRLSELSAEYKVTGVHAFTLDADENQGATAHCRNFAPLYDINEEAATGTANGALTYYLFESGLISDGTMSTFIQGEAMDRPSKVCSHIKTASNDFVDIGVGGNSVILAVGELFL